jgi:polysaccharide export outer membrane protein
MRHPAKAYAGRDTLPNIAPELHRGEKVTIRFSDLPGETTPHEQRIRDDGTITLPLSVTVRAEGLTLRELESEIRDAYVPRYYLRLTVVASADERWFSVGGEVKIPNRQVYADRITVLRAIQAAGDFTDFADRKRIELIRARGSKRMINYYEAKNDPGLDPEVYPGDQIIVPKRLI